MTRKSTIKQTTIKLMRKCKEWRTRALGCAIEFSTYPAGKPELEKAEEAVEYSMNKIRRWFGFRYGNLVINAIQRRAVNAFREQMKVTPC